MKTLQDIRDSIRAMNLCVESIKTAAPILVSMDERKRIRLSLQAMKNDCGAIRNTDLYHSLQFKEKFEVCFNLLQIVETLIELERKYPPLTVVCHN